MAEQLNNGRFRSGLDQEFGFRADSEIPQSVFPNPHNNITMIGGVPEWSKGTDCKSVGEAFGGSNPPPTTNLDLSHM